MTKILNEIKATIRWQIALFLNRFHDVCWTDAAMWALFPENHVFSEVLDLRNTAGRCTAMGETAYCGKCTVLGSNLTSPQ